MLLGRGGPGIPRAPAAAAVVSVGVVRACAGARPALRTGKGARGAVTTAAPRPAPFITPTGVEANVARRSGGGAGTSAPAPGTRAIAPARPRAPKPGTTARAGRAATTPSHGTH